MFGKQIFALLVLATLLHSSQADYNVTAFCSLVKPGTKLSSSESCSTYYACNSDGSYKEESCDVTYSFDKNRQTCAPSSSVNCYYGMQNPCANAESPSFVPSKGCGAYAYCVDQKVAGVGKCPNGQVFKDGVCMYGTCSTDSQSGSEAINICDIVPDDTYFGTSTSCDQYQICPAGKAAPKVDSCGTELYFDVKQGLCNYKEATDCSRVTGENIPGTGGNVVESCSSPNALKPNKNICSGYFKCDGQNWIPQSCGSMFWDVLTQGCVQRQKATPAEDCDRCEGCRGQFANAVDENCNVYYVCSKNKKVATSSCPSGYFDELAQACITSGGNLQAYAAANGACYKPTAPTCDCDSRTEDKCVASDGCNCGKDVNDNTKCITCTPEDLDAQGICGTKPTCDCESRAEDKCVASDGCNCGKDANDNTKCITCKPEDLDAQGVCGTASKPACDCDTRAEDKCVASDGCNCGKDANDNTKCITCKPEDLDAQGVCGTASKPACDCDTRAEDKCVASDGCNCGKDANDNTKCITCKPEDLDAQGVCGTASKPACDCDTRAEDKCVASDGCNCGKDVNDNTKCITCKPEDLDAQGVCGTAPKPACDCDTRAEDKCVASDGCNCGKDVNDNTKCITCKPEDLDAQGVCGTSTKPACDCDTRAEDKCVASDGCNCGKDVNDNTKCITCTPEDLDAQGVCSTASKPTCDCDTRTVDTCVAQDQCDCGLDVNDNTKCIKCDTADLCKAA